MNQLRKGLYESPLVPVRILYEGDLQLSGSNFLSHGALYSNVSLTEFSYTSFRLGVRVCGTGTNI